MAVEKVVHDAKRPSERVSGIITGPALAGDAPAELATEALRAKATLDIAIGIDDEAADLQHPAAQILAKASKALRTFSAWAEQAAVLAKILGAEKQAISTEDAPKVLDLGIAPV